MSLQSAFGVPFGTQAPRRPSSASLIAQAAALSGLSKPPQQGTMSGAFGVPMGGPAGAPSSTELSNPAQPYGAAPLHWTLRNTPGTMEHAMASIRERGYRLSPTDEQTIKDWLWERGGKDAAIDTKTLYQALDTLKARKVTNLRRDNRRAAGKPEGAIGTAELNDAESFLKTVSLGGEEGLDVLQYSDALQQHEWSLWAFLQKNPGHERATKLHGALQTLQKMLEEPARAEQVRREWFTPEGEAQFDERMKRQEYMGRSPLERGASHLVQGLAGDFIGGGASALAALGESAVGSLPGVGPILEQLGVPSMAAAPLRAAGAYLQEDKLPQSDIYTAGGFAEQMLRMGGQVLGAAATGGASAAGAGASILKGWTVPANMAAREGMTNAGHTYNELTKKGESTKTAREAALRVFLVDTMAGTLLNRFGEFAPDKGVIRRMVFGAPSEALEEVQQTINENLNTGKAWDTGLKEAALLGAAGGSLIGGFYGAVQDAQERMAKAKQSKRGSALVALAELDHEKRQDSKRATQPSAPENRGETPPAAKSPIFTPPMAPPSALEALAKSMAEQQKKVDEGSTNAPRTLDEGSTNAPRTLAEPGYQSSEGQAVPGTGEDVHVRVAHDDGTFRRIRVRGYPYKSPLTPGIDWVVTPRVTKDGRIDFGWTLTERSTGLALVRNLTSTKPEDIESSIKSYLVEHRKSANDVSRAVRQILNRDGRVDDLADFEQPKPKSTPKRDAPKQESSTSPAVALAEVKAQQAKEEKEPAGNTGLESISDDELEARYQSAQKKLREASLLDVGPRDPIQLLSPEDRAEVVATSNERARRKQRLQEQPASNVPAPVRGLYVEHNGKRFGVESLKDAGQKHGQIRDALIDRGDSTPDAPLIVRNADGSKAGEIMPNSRTFDADGKEIGRVDGSGKWVDGPRPALPLSSNVQKVEDNAGKPDGNDDQQVGGASSGNADGGPAGVSRTPAEDGRAASVPAGQAESDAGIHGDRSREGERPESSGGSGDSDLPSAASEAGYHTGNWHEPDVDSIGKGGFAAKRDAALAAIRTLKEVEARSYPDLKATAEEKAILIRFPGWGWTGNLFHPRNADPSSKRHKDYMAFREVLSDAEFESASFATVNSHFTDPKVIRAVWDAVGAMGFRRGNVLEPAVGVGLFPAMGPEDARWDLVELDSLSARFAAAIHTAARVQQTPFQEAKLRGNYDLSISNVPFANFNVHDPAFEKATGRPELLTSLHDYFIAKMVSETRPGGLVAVITSRYTMDKQDPRTRNWIREQAEFLGAVRLPSNAFKENAGTEVVTDLLFFRRLNVGEAPTGETFGDLVYQKVGDGTALVNEYFDRYPEMVLGTPSLEGGMTPGKQEYTVTAGASFESDLAAAIARLPRNVYEEAAPTSGRAERQFASAGRRTGSVYREGGKTYRNIKGEAVEVEGLTEREEKQVEAFIRLRDARLAVNESMRAGEPDAVLRTKQKAMRKAYDDYVKKFGALHKNLNKSPWLQDPDAYGVLALEDYDQRKKQVKGLAAIFEKRTVVADVKVDRASTPSDALLASLQNLGRVEFSEMARVTGKSEKELKDALVGTQVFFDQKSRTYMTAAQFGSGNVVERMKASEAAGDTKAVEFLETKRPPRVSIDEIDVRPGSPWIPTDTYRSFLAHILSVPASSMKIKLNPVNAAYSIDVNKWTSEGYRGTAALDTFGTQRAPAYALFELMMNNKPARIMQKDGDKQVVDVEETTAANAKMEELRAAWNEWVLSNAERARMLEDQFNDIVNVYAPQTFDGSFLTLPGMNSDFTDRSHRKNAILRILQNPSTLIAHEVGTGKTSTMQGAAMELRRVGMAKKPLHVVKNRMLKQYVSEFYKLYPSARLFVVTDDMLTPARRKETIAAIASGDWDSVVVPYSKFTRIQTSPEHQLKFYQDIITEFKEVMKGEDERTIKEAEKSLEKVRNKIKDLNKKVADRADDAMYWEELGVDALFVDEAHNFKNLFYVTKNRVKGLGNPGGSQQAFDMLMKVRQVQERPYGRVVFATGTPISNTVAELHTMLKFLAPNMLAEQKTEVFDAWAASFATVTRDVEQAITGEFKPSDRYTKFSNVPELMRMWSTVVDTVFAEDVTDKSGAQAISLPYRMDLEGNKMDGPVIVECYPTTAHKQFWDSLLRRAHNISKQPEGGRGKGEDNMLSLTTLYRKSVADMLLVDPDAKENPEGKIEQCARNVAEIYRRYKSNRSTQIVFLDLGVPKSFAQQKAEKPVSEDAEAEPETEAAGRTEFDDVSLYDKLKRLLIEQGVKPSEIGIFQEAKTDTAVHELQEKVRSGEIRVLIGSTHGMGEGLNVQDRLIALHHMQPGWKPIELIQRNGRAFRQGNMNPGVIEAHYVMKDSIDVFMWDTNRRKVRFINAITRGDVNVGREIEDISDQSDEMTIQQLQLAGSGSPLIGEMFTLEGKSRKLSTLREAHMRKRARLTAVIEATETTDIPRARDAIRSITDTVSRMAIPEKFEMKVGGAVQSKHKEAGAALFHAVTEANLGFNETVTIGSYAGLELKATRLARQHGDEVYQLLLRDPSNNVGESQSVQFILPGEEEGEASAFFVGIARRVENLAVSITKSLTTWESTLARLERELPLMREEREKPFRQEGEFQQVQERLREIYVAIGSEGAASVGQGWGKQVRASDEDDAAPATHGAPHRVLGRKEAPVVKENLTVQPEDAPPEFFIRMPIAPELTPEEKLAEIDRMTAENEPLLQRAVNRINAALGTTGKVSRKEHAKIIEKARRPEIIREKPWHDVEHVRDTLRFKIVANSLEDIARSMQMIIDEIPGVEVVKFDSKKLFSPKAWGWRMVAVDLRMPNGQLVEAYSPMADLDHKSVKGPNHDLFEKWRVLTLEEIRERNDELAQDIQTSRERYEAAWAQALERSGFRDEAAARASWTKLEASLLSSMTSKTVSSSYGVATASGPSNTQVPPIRMAGPTPSPITAIRPEASSRQTIDSSISLDDSAGSPVRNLGEPSSGRIPVAPIEGGKAKNLREIVLDVSEALGVPIRKGKPPATWAGEYDPRTGKVIIRYAGDLDNAAHELAHNLDDQFGVLGKWKGPRQKSPFDSELQPFWEHGSVATSGPKSKLSYKRAEGFAEFLRAYLVNPEAAIAAAPSFYNYLAEALPASTWAALDRFSADIRTWAGLPADQQVLSNVRTSRQQESTYRKLKRKLLGDGYDFSINGLDRFQTRFQDSLKPIMKAVRFAQEITDNTDLLPENDPQTLIRLWMGMNGKIGAVLEKGMVDSKLNRVTPGGLSWLLEPYEFDQNPKRAEDVRAKAIAWMVAERTIAEAKKVEDIKAQNVLLELTGEPKIKGGDKDIDRLTGIGAGIYSDQDVAERTIAELRKDPDIVAIEEGARRYRMWMDSLLRYMVDTGRMSEEGYAAIKMYDIPYVALHRVFEGMESNVSKIPSKKLTIGKVGEPVKRFLGSTREIQDPFESLIMQTAAILKESDRNKAMRAIVDLIRGDRRMYEGDVERLSLVGYEVRQGEPNTVKVFVDGKAEFWTFHEDVFKAIKGIGELDVTNFFDFVARLPARVLRSMVVYSPGFILRNPIRDSFHRSVVSKTGSGVRTVLSPQTAQELEGLQLAGGDQAGHYFESEEAWNRALKDAIKEEERKGRSLIFRGGNVFSGYKRVAQYSETRGRVDEYKTAFRHAKTVLGYDDYNAMLFAASEARDLLDYAIAGTWGRWINRYIPFTNAGTQGVTKSIKTFKEDPVGATVRWALYVGMPTVALYLAVLSQGDDALEELRAQPSYIRDLFWNIKIAPNLWLRIPKPFEMGVMASGIERILDKAAGNKQAFEGYGGSIVKTFGGPYADESSLLGPAHVLVEIRMNRDTFRDKYIVPPHESELLLELRKGTTNSSRLAQWIAKIFNADPRNVDHAIHGQFAEIGRLVTAVSDAGREDKSKSLAQWLGVATGMFVQSPAYNSPNVQWVLELERSVGVKGNQSVLADLIDRYFSAGVDAERDEAAKALRLRARAVRDALDGVQGGEAIKETLQSFKSLMTPPKQESTSGGVSVVPDIAVGG